MQEQFNSDKRNEENGNAVFAEIIIPLALPKNYTWLVPADFVDAVKPGIRVEVNLGKKKKYAGIVKNITYQTPAFADAKPILNILDSEPVVFEQQLLLWEWIADYYMCTEGEVMLAAVPSNLKLSSETILVWNDAHDEDFSGLDDKEFVVAEALQIKKQLKLSELQQILDSGNVYPVVQSLLNKQVAYVWEELQEKFREKTNTYLHLHPDYSVEEKLAELLNTSTRAPKQMELLMSYLHLMKSGGEVTAPELLKKSNASAAQLKALVDKKILVSEKRSVNRIHSLAKNISIDFKLTAAQQEALQSIGTAFLEFQTCLLFGVTASGKTNIYIKLIEQHIMQGKQVLYMLPEIALTAQIIRRLQKHFGGYISIYHSKFNPNERVEIWNRVKSGEIKIVLGARSALFLPFRDLGLIIADEEHDSSYKQQEPAPRYNARDAAIYYASLFDAKVLLGSATPAVESFHNCEIKKYALVTLKERFGKSEFPEILIIDTRKVISKEKVIISPQLKSEIEKTLKEGKQVILFKNRRGYSPYLICNVCGWIPQCRNCDVTLTYHKSKNKMVCHYCGTEYQPLHSCPSCGSHDFKQQSFGTERIEEAISDEFPAAKVARMDYDSIKGKHAHENIIKLFEQQRVDILVGTQMVVKGLDFEHVNLVGIIDADSILYFADFRVHERAFQLMEQVSGRAGRKDTQGKVFIQVMNVLHPVLQFVKLHDYVQLYNFEIVNRQNFFYPPFSRLIQLTFRHVQNNVAEEAAEKMADALKKKYFRYLTGPAQAVVPRVRNRFLWDLILKLPKDSARIKECKADIEQQIGAIKFDKRLRSVDVIIDVDPV